MILNIIMIVLLYILTLYWIIVSNIVYMMPWELIKDPTNPIFVVLIYWIFILWVYLLYVLFHWVYKKRINKNYMYSYLAFFPIFLIFYFWYYIQYDKWNLIPETTFETKLQNIEVSEEENWLIQLWEVYTDNDELISTILNLDSKIRNHYYCLTWDFWKKCEEENLENTLNDYKLEYETVEKVNNEISKLVNYEYFKQEIDWEYIKLQWLSAISRITLFSAIYELEQWNKNKAIDILLTYKKLWDKLLDWDNSLVWMIVWVSIWRIINNNLNYILDNYILDTKNLTILKLELNNEYKVQDIFSNTIKLEYWLNKYWYEVWFTNWTIKSNMLLNKEELYNEHRNFLLSIIEWKDNYYDTIPKNYFKRNFVYRVIGIMSSFSSEWYKESIEDVNIERSKILEKIELKLSE